MQPSDLKKAWQSQLSGRRLVFDEAVILRQVVRGQSDFRAMLFRRDALEIGLAVILIGAFVYFYFRLDGPWPLLLVAASMAWVAGFLLVDRTGHRRRCPHREDSVKACAESTLAEINHQIWLLKKVLWWYILPPLASLEIFYGYVAVLVHKPAAFFAAQPFTLVVAIGVYWLNRWAVETYLEPRRQETEALLRSLQADEQSEENGGARRT